MKVLRFGGVGVVAERACNHKSCSDDDRINPFFGVSTGADSVGARDTCLGSKSPTSTMLMICMEQT